MENSAAFFRFGVGIVDELDLVFRHTGGDQLFANIVINIKIPVIFRGGEIAEHKLGQLLVFALLPDLQHILHTDV